MNAALCILLLLPCWIGVGQSAFVADVTQHGVKWHGGKAAPAMPTAAHARRAVRTVFLEALKAYERHHTGSGSGATAGASPVLPAIDPIDPIDPEDAELCGPKPPGKQWIKTDEFDQKKAVADKFKSTYIFHREVLPDVFVGTDRMTLLGFDGMIRLRVEGNTMRLTVHNSMGESNVGPFNEADPTACADVNKLSVKLELLKLGVMAPDLTPETAGSAWENAEGGIWSGLKAVGGNLVGKAVVHGLTGGVDLRLGAHLHEMRSVLGSLLPASHKYTVQLQIALDASATLDPQTGRWKIAQNELKLCSPGLELLGDFKGKDGKESYLEWLAGKFKDVVARKARGPAFCFFKYGISSLPWVGEFARFVANDNMADATSVTTDEASLFQVSVDNKISRPSDFGMSGDGDRLRFRTGYQLNVPTLHFTSHVLATANIEAARSTAQEAANEAEATANEQETGVKMTAKDQRLLRELKALGFSDDVLPAIKTLQRIGDELTKSTAEASAWLSGVLDNVWRLLFTGGNEVEAMVKAGMHLDKDQAGGNGGVQAKLDHVKVSVVAEKSPVNLKVFLMNREDIIANVMEGEDITAERENAGGGTDVGGGGSGGGGGGGGDAPADMLPPPIRQSSQEEDLFHMRGKTTLGEINDATLSGSLHSLQRENINSFLKNTLEEENDHALAQELVGLVLDLVTKNAVSFDLTTTNSLPGTEIDHMSINTKRLKLGGEIGYFGPWDLQSVVEASMKAVNAGATAARKALEEGESQRGKCMAESVAKHARRADGIAEDASVSRDRCYAEESVGGGGAVVQGEPGALLRSNGLST
jgi:hypothetical protein